MSHPHPELSLPPALATGALRIVPLGGLGEVGRNMAVLEIDGKLLIIDCGVLFPEDHQPGVDLILPDFDYIAGRLDDVQAIVLTHGHEDHIGGVPYLLRLKPDIPLLGSQLTLALIEAKLKEHRIQPLTLTVREGRRERLGPFDCEFVAVNHSIPDALAVAVRTKSALMFSATLARVRRTMYANDTEASTIAGRTSSLHGASPDTVTRNSPSLMPKTYCSTNPTTNVGTEMSRSDTTSAVASNSLPLRRPAMTPTTMPATTSTSTTRPEEMATIATGSRFRTRSGDTTSNTAPSGEVRRGVARSTTSDRVAGADEREDPDAHHGVQQRLRAPTTDRRKKPAHQRLASGRSVDSGARTLIAGGALKNVA